MPAGGLDEAVETTVAAIAAAGPEAVRAQKALMRRWETESLPDAIENSVAEFVDAYKTGEPQRMMKAFLERRKKKGV